MPLDDAGVVAPRLLGALAVLHHFFIGLAADLRQRQGVLGTHRGFEIRRYTAEDTIEIFLEAQVTKEISYCWWLDVKWQEGNWSTDLAVLKTENGEQRVLRQFPVLRLALLTD